MNKAVLAICGCSEKWYFISYNWPMIERFICHGTWPLPSRVLNAHCLFWQFTFVLLDCETIAIQFICSLTFYFCSKGI